MIESKKEILKLAQQRDYIALSAEDGLRINLAGTYDYMGSPYFISQELEASGLRVRPSCAEMLDAYIVPILLEKAKTNGIAVPAYFISNGYFEPPVIIDPVNPFMFKGRTILSSNNPEKIAKSMTRNYTYAICCQELPPGSKIKRFRSILGWSVLRDFREISSMIWKVFRIPLARVRVIILAGGEILLSDISYLRLEDLNEKELGYLRGKVRWEK